MTASRDDGRPPGKLSIAILSDDFDRLHFGLVLASSGIATGREVTLFFTMDGTLALRKNDGDGLPGWSRLRAGDGRDGLEKDKDHVTRGVAGIEELLAAAASLGVRFLVCETGLASAGLEFGDLRNDLPLEVAGAVTFLNDASDDGTVIVI